MRREVRTVDDAANRRALRQCMADIGWRFLSWRSDGVFAYGTFTRA